MQQFIYSNVNHAGYVYLTSGRNIFSGNRKAQDLRQNSQVSHGNLRAGEYQSYMLSGLSVGTAAARHLILQAACSDPYRNGVAYRGYVADPKEVSGGGLEFLQFLRTKFETTEDILAVNSAANLGTVDLANIPTDENLKAEELPREAKLYILKALLDGKKVAVKIRETGSEAMLASRNMILGIYERIPFKMRMNTGFFTGGSAVLWEKGSTMPSDVKILLLDGDAYTANNTFERFWDIANPQPIPESEDPDYQELLSFLADSDGSQLNAFFGFVQKSCGLVEEHAKGCMPYVLCLKLWKKTQVSDNALYQFAVLLRQKWKDEQSKNTLNTMIAEAIPEKRMAEYIISRINKFENLRTFGQEDARETRAINSTMDNTKQQDAEHDINCAMSLQLAERLYSAEETERLAKEIAGRFAQCLVTEHAGLFSDVSPEKLYGIHELIALVKDSETKPAEKQALSSKSTLIRLIFDCIKDEFDAKEAKAWCDYQEFRNSGNKPPVELTIPDGSWKEAYSKTRSYAMLLLRAEGVKDERVKQEQKNLLDTARGDLKVNFAPFSDPVSLDWLEKELEACRVNQGQSDRELKLLRFPAMRNWLAENAAEIDAAMDTVMSSSDACNEKQDKAWPYSGILMKIISCDQSLCDKVALIYAKKTCTLNQPQAVKNLVTRLYCAGCPVEKLQEAGIAAKNRQFQKAAEQLFPSADVSTEGRVIRSMPELDDSTPFGVAFLTFLITVLVAAAVPEALLCLDASVLSWIIASAAMLSLVLVFLTASFVSKARPRKGILGQLFGSFFIGLILCALVTASFYWRGCPYEPVIRTVKEFMISFIGSH